jgi:very-short-patch-repair endonuclease
LSWQKFAPKQWTKAHLRLFHRLNKEQIPFITETRVLGFQPDFLLSPDLIVEVDGESHLRESRRRKDAWKDSVLRREGWTVLRFTDWRVQHDLDGVVDEIKEART